MKKPRKLTIKAQWNHNINVNGWELMANGMTLAAVVESPSGGCNAYPCYAEEAYFFKTTAKAKNFCEKLLGVKK